MSRCSRRGVVFPSLCASQTTPRSSYRAVPKVARLLASAPTPWNVGRRVCSTEASTAPITAASSQPARKRRLNDVKKLRAYLIQLGQALGIKTYDDWYTVSDRQAANSGGRRLFKYYDSLYSALKAAYPNHDWNEARFVKNKDSVTKYWSDPDHQRAFLELIAPELGVQQLSDWSKVQRKDIEQRGGKSLFRFYTSLSDALKALYPGTEWAPRNRVPSGSWNNVSFQKDFLETVGKQLGVKQPSDWYMFSRNDIAQRGGHGLFHYYPTLEAALRAVYPEYSWDSSKFVSGDSSQKKLPRGYWQQPSNQKQFLERVGDALGVTELSDWYRVSRKDVENQGGHALLYHYGSVMDALMAIYPHHPWDPQKYLELGKVPSGHWQNKDNLMHALQKAEETLGVKEPEDWYTVTMADLRQLGFPVQVSKIKLTELLAERYPDYKWEKLYLLRGKFAQQKRLERAVKTLFPDLEVKVNVRKEAKLVSEQTGEYLELDLYIPILNLAFEYQERHHYTSSQFTYLPLAEYKARDAMKKELAKRKGITLIIVPCWWDGQEASLVASIRQARTDLLAQYPKAKVGLPIGEEVPPGFFDKHVASVEDIGEPTTACFFTRSSTDPANWWIFEKYDGIRGFWNPKKGAFYSRLGNQFEFPQQIIEKMPSDLFLDGEIWFGRDNFQESMKVASRVNLDQIDWSKFKYMVYDIPNHEGSYEQRYNLLAKRVEDMALPFVEVAPKEVCRDTSHLEKCFQDIIDQGGEGIILRDPRELLRPGRSPGYLKHKKFRDAEAKVVAPLGPQRWECELPNGIRFVATPGTGEFAKKWDPQPGDVVSFKHHGFLLSTKKPKLPLLFRVRNDLSWEQVVKNWKEQKSSATEPMPLRKKRKHHHKGYWKKPENARQYLMEFAKKAGFDPLDKESWERVSASQVKTRKGSGLLAYYDHSLRKALEVAFPELSFADFERKQPTPKRASNYWEDMDNRRNFFLDYAEEMRFDPMKPENWKNVPVTRVIAKKGKGLLNLFNGSLPDALMDSFPELSWAGVFDESRTRTRKPKGYWDDIENRRKYFSDFAGAMGFDPYDGNGWYNVTKTHLVTHQRTAGPLPYFNGSLKEALEKTFEKEFPMLRSDSGSLPRLNNPL